MAFSTRVERKIKTAPRAPGVYIFLKKKPRATAAEPLYVGKASNVKNRLASYRRAGDERKIQRLQEEAADIKILPLRSEIEALIVESQLIKKLAPPYNVLWRDDKSYFYVAITNEKFPRIFITHKSLSSKSYPLNPTVIGPFTDGRALRVALRLLRRTFPFCTCRELHRRACLNAQINNCPGFCCRKDGTTADDDIQRYERNIRAIENFLLGKDIGRADGTLTPEERRALETVRAHREYLESFQGGDPLLAASEKRLTKLLRVEGYDISHLGGKETVGVMTAWVFDGTTIAPEKNLWRKFIVRKARASDDPAAIAETLSRRMRHPEWHVPDLMVIDGGISQLNAAREAVQKEKRLKIEIVSFAKPRSLVCGLGKLPIPLDKAPRHIRLIVPKIIGETHRFAVRFHRQRRRRDFLKEQ